MVSERYSKDEVVLCYHGDIMYEAKILDVRKTQDKKDFEYRVHYKGWKNTYVTCPSSPGGLCINFCTTGLFGFRIRHCQFCEFLEADQPATGGMTGSLLTDSAKTRMIIANLQALSAGRRRL